MGACTPSDVVLAALMVGKILTEDLIELEKNGLATGLKPGVPRKHLREINHALSILDSATIAEFNMSLEDEIAKLTDRVESLENRAETTNDLLAEILDVLKRGTTPPAQDNVVPIREVVTETTEPVVEEAPEASEDAAPTIDDVRAAMVEYGEHYGRAAMVDLGARFVPEGSTPNIKNIPVEKYGDVIAACGVAPEADAA